ncbi:MAG: hypothetical protein ACPG19_15170 [Saprospiraceae bacterium]
MAKIISIMQDDFEKFVRNNREEFDLKEPNFDLWNNIEQQLNQQEQQKKSPLRAVVSEKSTSIRRKMLRYASVAAVGLLLLTVGGVIGSQWSGGNYNNQPIVEISLGEVSDEYAELENYYSQQVNMNIEKLKKYNFDDNILEDIAELDAAFQELKRELGDTQVMSDEEIIHAMIENYQMKIDILERVLERIPNDKKSKNKEDDEPQRKQLNM